MPTAAERRALEIKGGQPVLTMTRMAFNAAGLAVEYGDHCCADQLVTAIRVVAADEALLAPSITRRLIEEFAHRPPPTPNRDSSRR